MSTEKEDVKEVTIENEKSIKITTIYDKAISECDKAKVLLKAKPGRFNGDSERFADDPSFWAKPSCSSCHGRGIEGTITVTLRGNNKQTMQQVCSCSSIRYKRWRDNWIKEYISNNE